MIRVLEQKFSIIVVFAVLCGGVSTGCASDQASEQLDPYHLSLSQRENRIAQALLWLFPDNSDESSRIWESEGGLICYSVSGPDLESFDGFSNFLGAFFMPHNGGGFFDETDSICKKENRAFPDIEFVLTSNEQRVSRVISDEKYRDFFSNEQAVQAFNSKDFDQDRNCLLADYHLDERRKRTLVTAIVPNSEDKGEWHQFYSCLIAATYFHLGAQNILNVPTSDLTRITDNGFRHEYAYPVHYLKWDDYERKGYDPIRHGMTKEEVRESMAEFFNNFYGELERDL